MRALATALLAVAFTAGPGSGPAVAAGGDWTVTGVQPIGQPIAVGGVAVGYVLRDRHVHARGIRPHDGTVIWEREVTPSKQTPGVEMLPVPIGDDAVFLEPQPGHGPYWARVVAVDAATGRLEHSGPPALFRTVPQGCFDDRAACVMATLDADTPMRGYRLDLDSGAFTPYPVTLPPEARSIGEAGLSELGGRPDERIALVRDGRIQWERPLTDAFPAGFSTSNGWNWTRFASDHVFAGSVFAAGEQTSTSLDLDLHADTGTAGLDERTGTVLWRETGTMMSCAGQIPLPGEPVRCRVRGREHVVYEPLRVTHRDLDVVLEGFDPRTGKNRWSVPAGASEQLGGIEQVPIAGKHSIAVELPAGPRLIDLTDGKITMPGTDAAHLCLTAFTFDHHQGYVWRDPTEKFNRNGGHLAAVCDSTGTPVASRRPSLDATRAVGAVAGGHAVVATADGYQGFALPD